MKLTKYLAPEAIKSPIAGYSNRNLDRLALIFVVFELINVVGFISINVPYVLFVGCIVVPILYIACSQGCRFQISYILFFTYLCLNVAICSPPSLFKSWPRLALFILLLFCCSPSLQSTPLRYFRFKTFTYSIHLFLILSVLSFICYFAGINYNTSIWVTQYANFSQSGIFSGLFWSSMILGPVSAIGACYAIWTYLKTKKKIWLVFAVAALGATMFSSSRSAVYGCVAACITIFYYSEKHRTQSLKKLLAVMIVATLSFPLWEGALSGINQKNAASQSLGAYGTRTDKFEARFAEIESNPLLGVGFAAIDVNGSDVYDPETGTVEPGSSWLCIMSMTGMIGLIFVLSFFTRAFNAARRTSSMYGPLVCGLIIFFSFHYLFEGYALAGGSILCFISWLIIGVGTDFNYEKQ